MSRRPMAMIIVVALAAVIGLSLLAGRMMGRGDSDVMPGNTTPPTATAGPTSPSGEEEQSREEIDRQREEVTQLVREFVVAYYSYVPGMMWADVRGKASSMMSAALLIDQDETYGDSESDLPVAELGLDLDVIYDVEAVLDSMTGEYDFDAGGASVSTALGVTSYTGDDQIDGYTILPGRLLTLEVERSGSGAWVIDGLTLR